MKKGDFVDVELGYKGRRVLVKCLVNLGACRSIISKRIADELGAFLPLDEPYEIKVVSEGRTLKIVGYSRLSVKFRGIDIPGGATFEVAENLNVDAVIGRPEVDAWDIIFTPEGPKLRRVPIELEVV